MALSTCQIVTVSKFKVPEGILDTVAFGIASTQTQTRSNRSNHLLTPFRLLLLGQCHVQIMEVALKLTENASLRGMQNDDGMWYWSVFDFINFVTGRELGSSYGRVTLLRLTNSSQYASEVVTNCNNLKFPGSGEKETPCMTLRGLQRLLLILGGKVDSQYREIVESVFTGRSRR